MMGAVSSSNAEPRQLPRIHVWIDTSVTHTEVDPIDVLMSDASSVIASLEDPLRSSSLQPRGAALVYRAGAGMELYRV